MWYWHLVFFSFTITTGSHSLTQSFTLSGLRDPFSERTSNFAWLPMHHGFSSHTHSLISTNLTWAMHALQSSVFLLYIPISRSMEHCHWSSLTSDWQFTLTTGYDTRITIIIQCNILVSMYVHDLDRELFHLDFVEFVGLHTTLLIINI